jgi:hypothetical protein
MKQVLHSCVRCLVFALWINTLYFNVCLFLALPIAIDHFLFVFELDLLGSKSQQEHRDFAPNRPDRLRSPHSLPGVKCPVRNVDLSPPSSGEVNSKSAPLYHRGVWEAEPYLLRELLSSGSLRSE